MATFFFRSETDENDRRVIAVYNNECWEVKLVELIELGPRIAVRPCPQHVLNPDTTHQIRTILEWAEGFQGTDEGRTRFDHLWTSVPLEHTVAQKVIFTSAATIALHDARIFLEELPADLGRGSLNGMKAQVSHRVREALR